MKLHFTTYLGAWFTALSRTRVGGWISIPVIALAGILGLDIRLSADLTVSMLYVVPIILTFPLGRPRITYIVFLLSSVATVAVAAFAMQQGDPSMALSNRTLALLAQVLAASVIIKQLEVREQHAATSTKLEDELAQIRLLAQRQQSQITELEGLLQGLPAAIGLLDADGIIVRANEAWQRLLGLEVEGRHWQEIGSILEVRNPGGQPISTADLLRPWSYGELQRVEVELLLQTSRSDRPLYLALSAAPLHEPTGKRLMGMVVKDISAQRALDRQKDEFVAMATHELRTPLSTLRGYLQLAHTVAEHDKLPQVMEAMGKTIRQVDRLDHLVTELLDVSRVHAGQLELRQSVTDLVALVGNAVEQQRTATPARAINLECEGPVPDLLADAARLEQVLANLLDNAIKYSPDGGPVQVRVWRVGQEVLTAITDTGVGIPKQEQERLFQRFYRGASGAQRFRGLGVGLYISHTLIEAHGGRMWVESEQGHGSTFGFALPLLKAGEIKPRLRSSRMAGSAARER